MEFETLLSIWENEINGNTIVGSKKLREAWLTPVEAGAISLDPMYTITKCDNFDKSKHIRIRNTNNKNTTK